MALDGWRAYDFVVENDGKQRADILGGIVAEFTRACGVETETDRRAAVLVKAGLRIDQLLAGDDRRTLDHVKNAQPGKLYRYISYLKGDGEPSLQQFESMDSARRPLWQVKREEKQLATTEVNGRNCVKHIEPIIKDVLVIFTAEWAKSKQEFIPIAKKIAKEYRLPFIELDYDERKFAVKACGVQFAPFLFIIKDGKQKKVFTGKPDEKTLKGYVNNI